MNDVPTSYYSTEACARFKQMNADIFKLAAQAKVLGFDGVASALHTARIQLGHEETFHRGEYRRACEAAESSAAASGVRASSTPSEQTPQISDKESRNAS